MPLVMDYVFPEIVIVLLYNFFKILHCHFTQLKDYVICTMNLLGNIAFSKTLVYWNFNFCYKIVMMLNMPLHW